VQEWLRRRGAETIEHPGGTLYTHLCRVHDRLGNLGLGTDLQLAGLTHAAYGTDGFDVVLVDRADRSVLRDLIGEDAEVIVYLYGACDRGRTWPRLADTGEVCNRFTGEVETPDAARLRTFVDLTVANELDIVEQDRAVAETYGAYFRTLFTAWAPIASPQTMDDVQRIIGTRDSRPG
jgi:hypothetical protein